MALFAVGHIRSYVLIRQESRSGEQMWRFIIKLPAVVQQLGREVLVLIWDNAPVIFCNHESQLCISKTCQFTWFLKPAESRQEP